MYMLQAKARENLPRKERERLARRKEILEAGIDLFSQKGYHETTLEEIARHAELGKGTIYHYFASKDELFYGIVDTLFKEINTLARTSVEGTQGGAREKLTAYAHAALAFAYQRANLLHFIFREISRLDAREHRRRIRDLEQHVQRILGVIARPIEADIKAGLLKPHDPMQLATLFDSTIRFFSMRHHMAMPQTLNTADIGKAADLVVSVFFDGIAQ